MLSAASNVLFSQTSTTSQVWAEGTKQCRPACSLLAKHGVQLRGSTAIAVLTWYSCTAMTHYDCILLVPFENKPPALLTIYRFVGACRRPCSVLAFMNSEASKRALAIILKVISVNFI